MDEQLRVGKIRYSDLDKNLLDKGFTGGGEEITGEGEIK